MPSIKPPAVQAAVIAKAMNGDSKRQIAEDLGLGRNTVTSILSDAELNQLVLEGKSAIYRLIPKSVQALDRAIDKGKTTDEAQLVLRNTGVLKSEQEAQGVSVNVNLGALPRRGDARN
jgi:transposase